MLQILICFVAVMFFSVASQARVFDFRKESFAGYIRGTYNNQILVNTLLSESHGNNVSLADEFSSTLSGEFGFIYSTGSVQMRFAFEVLRPPEIKTSGMSNAQAELYAMTSELSVYAPKLGLEVAVWKRPRQRFLLWGAVGSASLMGRNSYVLTPAGEVQFAPVTEHYEDLRGTASLFEGGMSYESLISDATTWVLEGGYRQLKFDKITHNRDVRSFSGNYQKGDTARNMDGKDRAVDLSQAYLAIAFRFWIL